jgi:hypothetical protein
VKVLKIFILGVMLLTTLQTAAGVKMDMLGLMKMSLKQFCLTLGLLQKYEKTT